ncbi:MAG: flagellar FlbD family protein [Treponema sp.]|nr:flagellar FlbD family protein [Treponema sp.]
MISVTKLDGKKYWLNPHMIESMEANPDVTISLLSGKKIVITDSPNDVIDRIVEYRRRIGIYKNEL